MQRKKNYLRSTLGVRTDPLTFMKDSSIIVGGSVRTPEVLRKKGKRAHTQPQ